MDIETSDKIIKKLENIYPVAECELRYNGEDWKLLIMAMLSAQCTDKRVNIVSAELFEKFPSVEALAEADINEIFTCIKSCGLYNTKGKNIKAACNKIMTDYGGRVPQTREELLTLPGVGRKIANLILGDCFSQPSIVTDTHLMRISARLGYHNYTKDKPEKIERTLDGIIPKEKQAEFCHRLVLFGRECCTAASPKCSICPLADLCYTNIKNKTNEIPESSGAYRERQK